MSAGRLFCRERIEQRHLKTAEVSHVAGDHREVMHLGDGGDHRVFVKGVGLTMHQLSPAAKSRAIEAEDVECVTHLIQPALDLGGLGGVLLAGAFNPGRDFAEGHAGEMQVSIVNALEPGEHGAMGAGPAQFRDHVGVKQEGHGLQLNDGPAAGSASRWHQGVGAGLGGQQQLLEAGPGCDLKTTPLLDRHQHGRFGTAPGDHLRALPLAGIEQLTEARFGVLYGPNSHALCFRAAALLL